ANVEDFVARGARTLGPGAPDELRARAAERVKAETVRSARARELTARRARDADELSTRTAALVRADAELAAWVARWTDLTTSVGLADLPVAAARKVIAALVDLARDWRTT